ncbi:MAG: hypothetical protein KHX08_05180 [Clostridiales bacterium]|nr:hypothetical protein [Clostridiales bacterium]
MLIGGIGGALLNCNRSRRRKREEDRNRCKNRAFVLDLVTVAGGSPSRRGRIVIDLMPIFSGIAVS